MNYPSIRIEGQIFSGEMLQRLDQADTAGQRPASLISNFQFNVPSPDSAP